MLFIAMSMSQAGDALAATPLVTITSPLNEETISTSTPTFHGSAVDGNKLTLRIYEGPIVAGSPIRELVLETIEEGLWKLTIFNPPLGDGLYTAQAVESGLLPERGTSLPTTFVVDTAAPTVTLNVPESPSDDATPFFTGTATDTSPVTVQISSPEGTIVSEATATGTGTGWRSADVGRPLPAGQYTAIAFQENPGNGQLGFSAPPVTFTVIPPPAPPIVEPPPPPTASFRWVPAVPKTGEPVLLVSSSTDVASPITGFAWALTSSDPFAPGSALLSTSFSSPGPHPVRLRVTDAAGRSSVATETIDVVGRQASLMEPFPVVRIAGTEIGSGVRLKLLKVQQVPAGARIEVRCKGHGCPLRFARRVTVRGRNGVTPVTFGAFERYLGSGVILEILISKSGEIGKYTRFAVRHGKLPERVDMCLDPAGIKPLVCPSS